MGFGKRMKEQKAEGSGFIPSTDEDLKRYKRAGRKSRMNRKEGKESRKEKKKERVPTLRGEALREALTEKKRFHVFATNLFGALIEEIKDSDKKVPRYDAYRKRRDADSKFVVDIVSHLSRMSWTQLITIIQVAITSGNRPTGLVTKSWTEAFLFAQHVVELALGVSTKDGTYRLTDLDVLVDWPVKNRKRPSKEDRMLNEDRARDDDDDDKDEEEEDENKKSSRDDDEPKKGKKKKTKKIDDEDEDEDSDGDADEDEKPKKKGAESKDDDDEDDEDDEDESPKKAKAKADEDDEDDEDESPKKPKSKSKSDEDEKPKGKGGKVSKKDKKEKKAVKDKSAKKAKPEKLDKAEMVDITKKSTVYRIGKRDKGGKKTKFLEIIPKNGIKVSELMDEAKEIGVKSGKVLPWLNAFQRYKFIKVG